MCILRINFHLTKVGAELELLLRAEVLVAEEHNTALRDEKRQLILHGVNCNSVALSAKIPTFC